MRAKIQQLAETGRIIHEQTLRIGTRLRGMR